MTGQALSAGPSALKLQGRCGGECESTLQRPPQTGPPSESPWPAFAPHREESWTAADKKGSFKGDLLLSKERISVGLLINLPRSELLLFQRRVTTLIRLTAPPYRTPTEANLDDSDQALATKRPPCIDQDGRDILLHLQLPWVYPPPPRTVQFALAYPPKATPSASGLCPPLPRRSAIQISGEATPRDSSCHPPTAHLLVSCPRKDINPTSPSLLPLPQPRSVSPARG